jgi:hypothetical protein
MVPPKGERISPAAAKRRDLTRVSDVRSPAFRLADALLSVPACRGFGLLVMLRRTREDLT